VKILFLACLLTVLAETALFALFGYRSKDDLAIVVYANIITNLSLNLLIALVFPQGADLWLLPLECLVVAVEYLIYAKAFGASKKLFLQTLAANVLSFALGVVLPVFGWR
jgi:hypothetical protein